MIENTKKMKAGEVPLNRKKDEMTISTKKGKLTDFLNFITKGITPYLIISVIVFGVYFQTLSYGFIGFDDDTIINRNIVNINNTSVIKEAFTRDAFFTHEMGYYRPLLTLSFIFNKATTGDNLFYFHLTNLILHLILCLSLIHI